MTGLCGWFSRKNPGGDSDRWIVPMASRLAVFTSRPAQTRSREFGAVAVVPGPGESADLLVDAHRLVAICGQPAFEDAALAEVSRRAGAAQALLAGYLQRGIDVVNELSGSFVLAIVGRDGEALLAIDRMGTRPLAYMTTRDLLIFGSTLDAVASFPGIELDVDPQAIYDYVHHHMVPAPCSIYAGVRRLEPGERVSFVAGSARTARYWEASFVENEGRPFSELRKEFREVLRAAVRRAAGPATGAFLSGGTDSSTVAGLLGEVTGEPARTYSIGFDVPGYDEMEYARIAVRHFGTRHHEYYVTPDDVVAAIPNIASIHDQPFGNSSAIPTYYCARLAKADGIETMLGGDGGDELFGGNERYAKQRVYSLYCALPPGLRRHLIEPVAFLLPEIGIVGKLQRYIRTAVQPMPARYDNYNLLERLGPAAVFDPEFLASVDPLRPGRLMRETYARARADSLINRMLAFDFKYTLADNDLPKVSRSCELAGVGVRYPMLDDTVVAFSTRLAPDLKLRRTKLRYFFKEALRGFLPDEIIAKSKHGFGLPFGPWLRTHAGLRSIAMDSLSDLRKRGIVRAPFLDDLASRHIEIHAAYYGTMVWVLMMLEQWFIRHRSARGNVSAPENAGTERYPDIA